MNSSTFYANYFSEKLELFPLLGGSVSAAIGAVWHGCVLVTLLMGPFASHKMLIRTKCEIKHTRYLFTCSLSSLPNIKWKNGAKITKRITNPCTNDFPSGTVSVFAKNLGLNLWKRKRKKFFILVKLIFFFRSFLLLAQKKIAKSCGGGERHFIRKN